MAKPNTAAKISPTDLSAAQRLRARLDEGSGNAAADNRLRELVDFWAQVRRVIAVNEASTGLEALDEVAAAVMLQDEATPVELTQTVLLLASPGCMRDSQAAEHEVFAPPAAPTTPTRTKRASRRFPLITSKPPPTKKQKKADPLPFDVPATTPAEIIADLRGILERAAAKKKTPAQVAYPWYGKRAWYEPLDHEDLHLLHWRFIMRHRAVFFLLALYAPTTNSPYRRSLKAKVLQARLHFLSANIEEFGWFGFMDRLENSIHDMLFWLGGRPAKHSASAKDKPTDGELASLLREDPKRYRTKIKRMLDPRRIDSDGYTSIPQLLEETGALDPTLKPHKRLSDRALARIVYDISKNRDYRGEWVGNKTTGPWKELISYEPLREEKEKVSALLKEGERMATFSVKPFKEAEQTAQDSDFKAHGLYAVRGPDDMITAGGPHFVPDKKLKASTVVTGLEPSDDSGEEEHEDAESDDRENFHHDKDSDDDEEKAPPSQTTDAADDEEEVDQDEEVDDAPTDK